MRADPLSTARAAWTQDPSEENAARYVHEAARAGSVLSLPAGLFLWAMLRNPHFAGSTPEAVLSYNGAPLRPAEAAAVAGGLWTGTDEWYPDHRGWTCPRGHEAGDNGFMLVQTGTNRMTPVSQAAPEDLEGFEDVLLASGVEDTYLDALDEHLECRACGASWPSDGLAFEWV